MRRLPPCAIPPALTAKITTIIMIITIMITVIMICAGWDLSDLTSRFALEAFNDVEDPLAWIIVGVDPAAVAAAAPAAAAAAGGDAAAGATGGAGTTADAAALKKLAHVASGSGGLEEITPHLKADAVVYGAFRVASVDRKGTRLSIR